MHRKGEHWTFDMTEELKTRHFAGENSRMIAMGVSALSIHIGPVTRNMVLGRLWRLGLSKKRPDRSQPRPRKPDTDQLFRRSPRQARTRRGVKNKTHTALGQWTSDIKRMTRPHLPVDDLHSRPSNRCIGLEDLTNDTCRWPMWPHSRKISDAGPLLYCGAPIAPGLPYCCAHRDIAYAPAGRVNTWLVPKQ